jgi:hypothetical protein
MDFFGWISATVFMDGQAMTDASANRPKTKLRWYQFSLRSLLIFMTLFAFACSWFAVKMGQATRQKEAVETLKKKAGKTIYYDYQFDPAGKLKPNAQLPGPAWLRKWLGDDFFCTAVKLEWINYNTFNRRMIDAELEPIERLSELREIDLTYGDVTDRGLLHFKKLRQLKKLNLSYTDMRDAGLSSLAELTGLESLSLTGTHISDEGLSQLKALTELRALNLSHINISDAGVANLLVFDKLEELWLTGTIISDEALKEVKKMKQLKKLHLSYTKISDAGLEPLEEMKQLENLWAERTSISEAGVRKLKKALPKVRIYR